MAKLFRRLATGYRAGIDIRSLYQRETETGSPAYRINSQKVYKRVKSGNTLAQAMTGLDGYFPDLAIAVVQAGEKGGRLEDSFTKLSQHYESLVKFRNSFLTRIAWPAFELFAAICIVSLMIFIIGWISDSLGKQPFWGRKGFSDFGFFLLYWTIVLAIGTGIATLLFGVSRGWFGTPPMRIARRIPLIGSTIESLALSRFAWTMSVAENAGMSAQEIGQLSLRSTQNYYYRRLEPDVEKSLKRGQSFYQTFDQTDSFPQEFLLYIDNGEVAGELSESMERASKDRQQHAERNLQIIGTVGFMLTFIFVALVVGGTVIWMYSMYLGTLNDIANW